MSTHKWHLVGPWYRWGSSEEILVQGIQNPQAAAATGDPYVKSLVDSYVGTYGWMTAQAVSADDVKDIMAYVQNPPDVVATADTGTDCPTIYDALEEEQGANGTIWFLILLTLFLIIALSAATVRRSLERAAQEVAEDDDAPYIVRLRAWAWDNIAFVSILGLFVVAYLVVIGLGIASAVVGLIPILGIFANLAISFVSYTVFVIVQHFQWLRIGGEVDPAIAEMTGTA